MALAARIRKTVGNVPTRVGDLDDGHKHNNDCHLYDATIDCKHLTSATVVELAIADSQVNLRVVFHTAQAIAEGSTQPIEDNIQYFKSAFSAMGIWVPLIGERISAGAERRRSKNLKKATYDDRQQERRLTEWEIETVVTPCDKDDSLTLPTGKPFSGFLNGVKDELKTSFSFSGVGKTLEEVTYTGVKTLFSPISAGVEAIYSQNSEYLDMRAESLPDELKKAIELNYDENGRIVVDIEHLDAELQYYGRQYRKKFRQTVLGITSMSMASYFIFNETVEAVHKGQDAHQTISEIFQPPPPPAAETDHSASLGLSIAFCAWHIVAAFSTFSPLKRITGKVGDHQNEMRRIKKERLAPLKHIKAQHTAASEAESYYSDTRAPADFLDDQERLPEPD